jgi:hypothetical protein
MPEMETHLAHISHLCENIYLKDFYQGIVYVWPDLAFSTASAAKMRTVLAASRCKPMCFVIELPAIMRATSAN